MDLDDMLDATALPRVNVDVDLALQKTVRAGRARRRRRRGALGGVAAVAITSAGAMLVVSNNDDGPSKLSAGPGLAVSVPTDPEPGDAAVWVTNSSEPPSPESSTFTALVSRLGCNSGVTGQVLHPGIRASETDIIVTFTVEPDPDGGDCPTNDLVPFEVYLGQRLGDRVLVDGACSGDEGAGRTSFCDPDGVRWDPATRTGGPSEEGATPEPHECAADEGSDIDVAHEPDWRQYADYMPWTDQNGCLLRIDVLAERPMPEHCGWESARVLITGPTMGQPYAADSVHYVRDPEGVLEMPALTESLRLDATLPPTALDTGYRRGAVELWHVADDASSVWLVSAEGVERWPAGETPICN